MLQLSPGRSISAKAGWATHTGSGNDRAQRARRLLEPYRLEGSVLCQLLQPEAEHVCQALWLGQRLHSTNGGDGTSEFVGSNSDQADEAFRKALGVPKIPVRLSSISADASNTLHAHLETGALDSSFGSREAEVYVAVALNRAESQVSAGENSGHRLTHVSVVKSLTRIGALKQGQVLAQDVQLKLEPGSDSRSLRLIAFVQEPRQGRVLGAASMPVSTR